MRRLVAVVLCILLSGCATFVSNPEVNVQRVTVMGLDTRGLDLEFLLNVRNPNPFGVKLRGYSYDVQVMALPVAKGGARDVVEFKANGETDMRLPVRIQYRDLIEVLRRRPDPDSIPCRLSAGLELDTILGNVVVPLEKSATFAVPQEVRPSWILKQASETLQKVWK